MLEVALELTEQQRAVVDALAAANLDAVTELQEFNSEYLESDHVVREEHRQVGALHRRLEESWCGNPLSNSYRYYKAGFDPAASRRDMVWLDDESEADMRRLYPNLEKVRQRFQQAHQATLELLRRVVPPNAVIRHFEGLDSAWNELDALLQRDWGASEAKIRRGLQPTQALSRFWEDDMRMMMPVHRHMKAEYEYWTQSYLVVREKPGRVATILSMITASLPFARLRVDGKVPQVVINNENRQEDRRTQIGNDNEITGTNAIGEGATAAGKGTGESADGQGEACS